jgi:hypothetical protein
MTEVTIPANEEFRPWPKTPRLYTEITVTEKIDGTNACVVVTDDGQIFAQSRKRFISPAMDNHGFASWVQEHADKLVETLGPGHHYGEWWGHGINRGYGCERGDKRFSLFNTAKWGDFAYPDTMPDIPGLGVVPTLYQGDFDEDAIISCKANLEEYGSEAKPDYLSPEGICIYHKASNQIFKWPFGKND